MNSNSYLTLPEPSPESLTVIHQFTLPTDSLVNALNTLVNDWLMTIPLNPVWYWLQDNETSHVNLMGINRFTHTCKMFEFCLIISISSLGKRKQYNIKCTLKCWTLLSIEIKRNKNKALFSFFVFENFFFNRKVYIKRSKAHLQSIYCERASPNNWYFNFLVYLFYVSKHFPCMYVCI